MRKITTFLVAAILFAACNKSMTDSGVPRPQANGTTIPLTEALSNLDNVLSKLDVDTKSGITRSYSTASVLGSQNFNLTKAPGVDIPDTLMYIVNFNDNQGFAVLAGDRRLGENVYCVTENGVISASDFEEAFNYLHSDTPLTKSGETEEGDFVDIGQKFVPALMLSSMLADLKYGKVIEENKETKAKIKPSGVICLSTKWGQKEPFNKFIPGKFPTGCVATACAQVMQYCKIPSEPIFLGITCSWELMETVYNINGGTPSELAKDQTALFLADIGSQENCKITYGEKSSSGYASGVVRTLKNFGYKDVKKHLGFGSKNQKRASSMIGARLPIYIDGTDYHHGGGHAWVLDGDWNGYFHCNWGWYGIWDGFYAKHNYFPVDAREYVAAEDSGTTSDDVAKKDYDWDFSIITYIVH